LPALTTTASTGPGARVRVHRQGAAAAALVVVTAAATPGATRTATSSRSVPGLILDFRANGGGGFDLFDKLGMDAWRCDLLQGRKVTPIGASDNHRVNIAPPGGGLDPALGWPSTSVFAAELTWPAVIKGLRAGHVALHEGDSFLQLDAYDGDKRHATGQAIRWLRLRGTLDQDAPEAVLTLQRATACEDPRPKGTPVTLTQEALLQRDIMPGETFDVAVEIKGGAGVYTAILKPSGVHYVAISRAFVIAK